MAKILFYAKRNLHLPHMEPIRKWLADNYTDIDIRISSPVYVQSREGRPGVGLKPEQIEQLRLKGINWIQEQDILSWNPDVTVLADADFASIFWGGSIVNVNHGLISKGFYYTNTQNVQRENAASLICVPGEHHAQVLRQSLNTTILASGFVKFDPVGRGELTRSSARQKYGVPENAEVVTFAPTFNLELSGIPVVTDRIREIVGENRYLLLKLHGMTPAVWVEMYKLLSRLEDHIIYVEDNDLTPALVAADVVISDVSSAFMEAMALDKPVVLIDNPLQKSYFGYNPDDIEYRWRDVGLCVGDADSMLSAVDRSFEHPEEKAELRHRYGPLMVGPIDGKAAERAANGILKLINKK